MNPVEAPPLEMRQQMFRKASTGQDADGSETH